MKGKAAEEKNEHILYPPVSGIPAGRLTNDFGTLEVWQPLFSFTLGKIVHCLYQQQYVPQNYVHKELGRIDTKYHVAKVCFKVTVHQGLNCVLVGHEQGQS